jgi:hypothetical protein
MAMPVVFCVPKVVRRIADCYKDIATNEGIPYSVLCAYIAMNLFGNSSISSICRYAPWTYSCSSISEHLSKLSNLVRDRIMRRLRSRILKRIKQDPTQWIFVVDTTKKPTRIKSLNHIGSWRESSHNSFYGVNLLVVTVVNIRTGVTLPLDVLPCEKSKPGLEKQSTAWELILKSLDKLVDEGFPKLPLSQDSWFDGVEFANALKARGFTYETELKSSRLVKEYPYAPRISLKEAFSNVKKVAISASTREISNKDIHTGIKDKRFVAEKILYIRSSKTKKSIQVKVAAVYNHQSEKDAFAYYFTNDISKSGVWLWKMSRLRWNIEVLFRDLKQNLDWGNLASQEESGLYSSLISPFLIVVHLRLTDHQYKTSENTSLGAMIDRIQQEETLRSIEFIRKNPNNSLIKLLKNRLDPKFATRKPANMPAEERKLKNVA